MMSKKKQHAPIRGGCCAGSRETCEVADELRAYLGSSPASARAVRRLMVSRHASAKAAESAHSTAGDDVAAKQLDLTAKLAMQALLSTLQPCSPVSDASSPVTAGQRPDWTALPEWQSRAAGNFASILMSTPQLISSMPSQVRTQLTSLKAFSAYMLAVELVAGQPSHSASATGHSQPHPPSECRACCQR